MGAGCKYRLEILNQSGIDGNVTGARQWRKDGYSAIMVGLTGTGAGSGTLDTHNEQDSDLVMGIVGGSEEVYAIKGFFCSSEAGGSENNVHEIEAYVESDGTTISLVSQSVTGKVAGSTTTVIPVLTTNTAGGRASVNIDWTKAGGTGSPASIRCELNITRGGDS